PRSPSSAISGCGHSTPARSATRWPWSRSRRSCSTSGGSTRRRGWGCGSRGWADAGTPRHEPSGQRQRLWHLRRRRGGGGRGGGGGGALLRRVVGGGVVVEGDVERVLALLDLDLLLLGLVEDGEGRVDDHLADGDVLDQVAAVEARHVVRRVVD